MAGLIKALDTEQEQALGSCAQGWLQRALSRARPDWPAFESALQRCYASLDLQVPTRVVRTASPLSLARALFLAGSNEAPGAEQRALAGLLRQDNQLRVERALSKAFDRKLLARVRARVFAPVDAALRDGEQVADAVAEALRDNRLDEDPLGVQQASRAAAVGIRPTRLERANRTPESWQAWRLHLGGLWESAWCAYTTFLTTCYTSDGSPWNRPSRASRPWRERVENFRVAQSADWWFPHRDFVLVSDRPNVLRTENDLLHNADGPAVAWRDGWRLYFWHGTRVPEWVIRTPTLEAVNAESNVEVRRCAIEAMGWDAYLDQAGLSLVDTAQDPGNLGCQLRLFHVPEDVWGAPVRVLLATNGSPERDGTRRRYALPVPEDMDTALNAAAWTYGLTGEQYAGLVRRT